jgi:hypothetical protein
MSRVIARGSLTSPESAITDLDVTRVGHDADAEHRGLWHEKGEVAQLPAGEIEPAIRRANVGHQHCLIGERFVAEHALCRCNCQVNSDLRDGIGPASVASVRSRQVKGPTSASAPGGQLPER